MATKKTTKKVAKFATKTNIKKMEKEGYVVVKDSVAEQYNAELDEAKAVAERNVNLATSRLKTSENQASHIVELQGVIKGLRSDVNFYRVISWVAVTVLLITHLTKLI